MKPTSLFVIFSFIPFLSASSASPNALTTRFNSAAERVFEDEPLLKSIIELASPEPSLRLVSRNLKRSHDSLCKYYLTLIDSRLKNYLRMNDVEGQNAENIIFSPISPTLRLEVPLYYLFARYLKYYTTIVTDTRAAIENSVAAQNEQQVELGDDEQQAEPIDADQTEGEEQMEVVEADAEQGEAPFEIVDAAVALRNQEIAEGRRFIKDVMIKFTRELSTSFPSGPSFTLRLYILARACFDAEEFNQIGFPINQILGSALKGEFPDPYNAEILTFLDAHLRPSHVHVAFSAKRPDLARMILSRPGISNDYFTYYCPSSRISILHYCAGAGAVDLINRCLELGVPPSVTDSNGARPINYAVANGHIDAVRRLFDLDQDVLVSGRTVLSPILSACYGERAEIVKLFLSSPSVTLIGNLLLGNELIDITLTNDDARMARVLLESGKLEISDEEFEMLAALSLNHEV